jgi:SAM-dependent methyltransferase
MSKSWLLDERAHAGPEHLDPAFVAGYDRKQGTPDPREDIAILEARGLGRDANVLDLGAGTGQFALEASGRFGRVTAVDVSAVMVDELRSRAASRGVGNLDVLRAGFLTFEARPGSFDAAYSRNALHHLPDFWKAIALDRVHQLLRPGGVLRLRDLVYDFSPTEADAVFESWLGGAVKDPTAGYTRDDYAEHIRTEFSTFRWLLEPMLESTGFEIVSVEYAARIYAAYTCVTR